MFIIDDIISWLIGKILDKFFSKKDENTGLIKSLQERIFELQDEKIKSDTSSQLEGQKQENEKRRIIDSLKLRPISVNKLIEKYDNSLFAVLISYASQKEKGKKGYLLKSPFLRTELEKYNSKYLGGTDALIPPTKVPIWIKNENDLKKWFETDILKGRYCKIKFLSLIDLKKKTFWGTYLPYKQKKPNHFTIGEVLKIEDIFTEEHLNTISLSQIIREGDVCWLASSFLSGKELELLIKNQIAIEEQLGNPTLREFSQDSFIPKLTNVLSSVINNPKEVACSIVEEAKFWENKLM